MEYTSKARHGDIAEHLVAFRIMKLLGWPCRLYGIDLGVDAEVEILDAKGITTGDIIKLQVKSVQDTPPTDKFEIYCRDDHVEYWQRFSTPVIFCGVDLSNDAVYWKQITASDSYDTRGVSKKITFSKNADTLSADTKIAWSLFVTPREVHELAGLMETYRTFEADTANGAGDLDMVVAYDERFVQAKIIEIKIERIISIVPWKINGNQLALYQALKEILNRRKRDNDQLGVEILYN